MRENERRMRYGQIELVTKGKRMEDKSRKGRRKM